MAEAFLSNSWYRVQHLRLKLRDHVQVHRHRYRGKPWYVVQDHLMGQSHRLTPAAYSIAAGMDGTATVQDLWISACADFGEEAPSQDQVIRLIAQLHSADLVQSDLNPDGEEIRERYAKQKHKAWLRSFTNPLSIRIPVLDPNDFLNATVWLVRPFIGLFGLLMWMMIVGAACVVASMNWSTLTENVSDRVMASDSLVLLALVYPVTKLFHELGHGYVAKSFGAEVHDAGVMLLVGYPVPYVDASGASAFRSKARRIAVGAGGMLFEVLLAALALFGWILVEPGTMRTLLFNVMFIAGVSTVIFNINPLLRYDGYFMLADLLEIPNFGIHANRHWAYLVDRYVFGIKAKSPAKEPVERALYLFYAPTAFIYRGFITVSLSLLIASQLFFIGIALAAWAMIASFVLPLGKALRYVIFDGRLARNRRRAMLSTFSATGMASAAVAFLPLPLWTNAEGVTWLPDEAYVRAGSSGFVKTVLAAPGSAVTRGTRLVAMEDPTLDAEIAQYRGRLDQLAIELNAQRFTDRSAADVTAVEIEKTRSELGRAVVRKVRLIASSPGEGTLVLPEDRDLSGRYVREGDILGYILPGAGTRVRTSISQDDIDLVQTDLTAVRIIFADLPGQSFQASVMRGVPSGQNELPSKALGSAGGGHIAVDPRDERGLRTLRRSFQFDLQLPESAPAIGFGGRAYIRFEHRAEPAAVQLYRRIRQLFLSRFDV